MKRITAVCLTLAALIFTGCSTRHGTMVGPDYRAPVMTHTQSSVQLVYKVNGNGYSGLDKFDLNFPTDRLQMQVTSARGSITGANIQVRVYSSSDEMIFTKYFNPSGSLTETITASLTSNPDHVEIDVPGYSGELEIVLTSY